MMINKRLLNICKNSRKYIYLTVITSFCSALCNFSIILLIGRIINTALQYSNSGHMIENIFLSDIGFNVMVILVLLCIRVFANLLYSRFSHKSSAEVKVNLRDMIYSKLLKLGPSYTKVTPTSSVVQSAIEGVEALEVYFGRYLPQLFYALLAPISLFVILSFISFKTALVFILCVPLIPISIILIMKIAKRILKEFWNSYTNLADSFLDNLQGLTTLKIFNMDEEKHRAMNEEAEEFRKVTMKVLSMQLNSITVMDLIAFGGAALGSLFALRELSLGAINVGQTIAIILLSSEFFIPLRLLGSFFHIAMNGLAAADKIFILLDATKTEIHSIEGTLNEEDVATCMKTALDSNCSIEIKNLSFSYDGLTEVIKNISMSIPSKSFTAIVGESGSGKSTVASLLLKIHDVTKGEILFNGVDIKTLENENIYKRIALISTNSYIFNGSILDNLIIAKKDATESEINRALISANLKDFVDSLADGLHTNVGEGGTLLSGGQRQRLALARAILADREIYVFDEATSNIDVESEEMILKCINELSKEKTILMISHRLANVRNANTIYVMHDGEVAERGTHEELMEQKGIYFKMVTKQYLLEEGGLHNEKRIRI